jgi:hypothetical protein
MENIKVYDIPAKWLYEKILAKLLLWGKMISVSIKLQKKYCTVHVKIELNIFALATFKFQLS